ncbi:MAG: hypothetical protein D6815_07180 [Candidatus Dadabacteria bacterium]|nr:MAG: hypothetical protein D6815_07180 [Candidatus Dadabacteria bacterium]
MAVEQRDRESEELRPGDEVVHQGHPGRFRVLEVRPRPAMNVYSNIVRIRNDAGVELEVLDTTVRRVDSD